MCGQSKQYRVGVRCCSGSAVPCDHASIARPLTPLLWHRSPVLRNTDCSQAAWSSHRGDTLQWPPLPTEGATCSLPHHPHTHHLHDSHHHPALHPCRRPAARLHRPTLPKLPRAQSVRRQSFVVRGRQVPHPSYLTNVLLLHPRRDGDRATAPGGHSRGLKAPSPQRNACRIRVVVLRKFHQGVDR